MVQVDSSDINALVHSLRTESTAYFRRWVVWLGVASGAGGMGLFSLAANLPIAIMHCTFFFLLFGSFYLELPPPGSVSSSNRSALAGEASVLPKRIIGKS